MVMMPPQRDCLAPPTVTNLSESEEFATEVLSDGYLVETYHGKHVVYTDNECVNNQVHRALSRQSVLKRAARLL